MSNYYLASDYIYKRKVKNIWGIITTADGFLKGKEVGNHFHRKWHFINTIENYKLNSLTQIFKAVTPLKEKHFGEQKEFILAFLKDHIKELNNV